MLDMQDDFQTDICDKLNCGPLDAGKLLDALKSLSPAELEKLEDDLDFAQFTGVQSPEIRDMIKRLDTRNIKQAA
ncbi:hypothetical protein [Boseongicola aestuarii]|jgi:hypothetical protein|uniref:Uncharacterized protein n=1 Tax=Boseongicola aestuarii TaxID=1470561 RepID=A0A238J341_9RHOB|nr:hypothetical protein [Boseongicola aestuarii]SMX24751.1 hypothetical protein BOA8489_02879 [Boseongicola aestuarii]